VAKFVHEIRNPLQKILLGAHVLEKELQIANMGNFQLDTLEIPQIIMNATNEVSKLADELLNASKTPRLDLAALDVSQVIDNTLKELEYEIEKADVRIIKDHGNNLPAIKGDRLKINQVFVNLIKNAVQAMPCGGGLRIASQMIDCRELKELLALQGRDIDPDKPGKTFIKIIFSDTGPGIAREAIPNIFTPFYTTKAAGMGLGLTIVKEIVEIHGGLIHVESQEKQGSQFVVFLPTIE
jgi:signal transduction histidine kinase